MDVVKIFIEKINVDAEVLHLKLYELNWNLIETKKKRGISSSFYELYLDKFPVKTQPFTSSSNEFVYIINDQLRFFSIIITALL